MPSCSSNSSNLSGNVNINNITTSGARLLMTLPLTGFSGGRISGPIEDTDGVTAGDAIRYDNASGSVSEGKYIKARADTPANSEVVGIIEGVTPRDPSDPESGIATIVISGQINSPSGKLVTATHIDVDAGITGSAGGNDVYFLSAATAGVLQNLAPTEATQVIKPIYQVAPDSPWTGQVVNYIGYQSGGQIVAEDFRQTPPGTVVARPDFGNINGQATPGRGWISFGQSLNLDSINGKTYLGIYNELGPISRVITRCFIKESPTSSNVNKFLNVRKDNVKVLTDGKIIGINSANKYIDIEWKSSNYSNIKEYLTDGRILNLTSGTRYTLSSFTYSYFVLPKVSSTTQFNSITFDIDQQPKQFNIQYYVYAPEDIIAGDVLSGYNTVVVSIPPEITAKKLNIKDTLTIENSDVTISDLASAIKTLQDNVVGLGNKVHGASQSETANIYVTDN